MSKKRADNNRQEDYGNIGTSFGNPGTAPDVPVSRTDQSNKDQAKNDGDDAFHTKIEFENDAQTPGIVDSPVLDDSLDFRRITPMANLRERFTVSSIERLCGVEKTADTGFSAGDEIEFRLPNTLHEGSEFQEGDIVKGEIKEVVDEGYLVKLYDSELNWIFKVSLLKDDPTIKKIGSKKTAAKQNSLSLLNVKKQKSKQKFDLENRAMIDRSKDDSLYGKDRTTQHIKNQTGRIGSVKLADLKQHDRINVADEIMEIQSVEKDGVIARNVWNGFDRLITGSKFIRVQAALNDPVQPIKEQGEQRTAAWFETAERNDGMFDPNGGDHRDATLGTKTGG